MMEMQKIKKFEFKEILGKWRFLEKDPIREKNFITILRKYKQFYHILQAEAKENANFAIKIDFHVFLKEVKYLKEEIEIFFQKTSKTQLEQGLMQIRDDLLMILDFFTQKYEICNQENSLKEKENLLNLSKSEDIFLNLSQKESEILKPLSQTNSLIVLEKLSPEIKVLKKTPGKAKNYQNHSNEKNSRHEKEMEIRSELEDQLLTLSQDMKGIAQSYTSQLRNDKKALENINQKQQKNIDTLGKGTQKVDKYAKLTNLSFWRLVLMLLFSVVLFCFTSLVIIVF